MKINSIMKKMTTIKISAIIIFLSTFHPAIPQLNSTVENKVSNLVKQMTLEEKVGQMAQVSLSRWEKSKDNFVFDKDKLKDAVENYKIWFNFKFTGIH